MSLMRAVIIVIIMTHFNSNKIRVVFYREENEWSAIGENATSPQVRYGKGPVLKIEQNL